MSRQALLALLRHRIGLDGESLGERVLNDALAESRAALAVADDEQLYARVFAQPEAFANIIERFVVPESWFFRAPDQYADLVRFAGEQRYQRPLRVLSLPCASGEEAYSAAIALLDAGLSANEIDVLGIDVSRAAVERAQKGAYRSYALRGRAMAEPWIQPHPGGFTIADSIKRCARFRIGNALDPQLLDPSERFDAIFCRNLLIYLHADARARVLTTLLAALEPWGLLFSGQAEVLAAPGSGLRPYPGGCPLSYVRDSTPTTVAASETPVARVVRVEPTASAKPASRERVDGGGSPLIEHVLIEPVSMELTPQALADAGRLDEARAACEHRLKLHPEDIETLFLLGLVQSARADLGAADEAFSRVCYLDRDHLPAMNHRIALAERLGRRQLANELRKRSQRLRDRLGRPA